MPRKERRGLVLHKWEWKEIIFLYKLLQVIWGYHNLQSCSLCSNLSQSCHIRLSSGLRAGQSSISTPTSVIFMDLGLRTAAQSCWNIPQNSKMSCYAKALRVSLTGTTGPTPAPHHNPRSPNFTSS